MQLWVSHLYFLTQHKYSSLFKCFHKHNVNTLCALCKEYSIYMVLLIAGATTTMSYHYQSTHTNTYMEPWRCHFHKDKSASSLRSRSHTSLAVPVWKGYCWNNTAPCTCIQTHLTSVHNNQAYSYNYKVDPSWTWAMYYMTQNWLNPYKINSTQNGNLLKRLKHQRRR